MKNLKTPKLILGKNFFDSLVEYCTVIKKNFGKRRYFPGGLHALCYLVSDDIGRRPEKNSYNLTIEDFLSFYGRKGFDGLNDLRLMGKKSLRYLFQTLKDAGVHENDLFYKKEDEIKKEYW